MTTLLPEYDDDLLYREVRDFFTRDEIGRHPSYAKIEDTKEKRILLPQQKTLLVEPEEINHYLMLRVASDWWSNGEGYDMKPRQSWIEIGDNDEMYFCWD